MADSKNIIKNVLLGIKKAQKAYEAWSGGNWLGCAPEYLITTYIAKEIAIGTRYYVTLEQDGGELTPGKGKTSENIRRKLEGGRFDIVVWDDWTPVVIIEVKRQPDFFSHIKGDVENICSMVKRNNSIEYGLIAFYTAWKEGESMSAEERTLGSVKRIKSNAYDHINKRNKRNKRTLKLRQYLSHHKPNAWLGVVLKISKKPE